MLFFSWGLGVQVLEELYVQDGNFSTQLMGGLEVLLSISFFLRSTIRGGFWSQLGLLVSHNVRINSPFHSLSNKQNAQLY